MWDRDGTGVWCGEGVVWVMWEEWGCGLMREWGERGIYGMVVHCNSALVLTLIPLSDLLSYSPHTYFPHLLLLSLFLPACM